MARPYRTNRIIAALGSVALQALLLYGLFVGLSVNFPSTANRAVKLFEFAPPPPPPAVEKRAVQHTRRSRRAGAAAPRGLRAKATDIVAPPPRVAAIVPQVLVAARQPDVGSNASSGASDRPGPGMGAGGAGSGPGSGGSGTGNGAGSATPPRQRSGRLKESDYPVAAREIGATGTVSVLYTVRGDGRVTDCTIAKSSGNTSLDETTCRLIEQRFRFDPERDQHGRPVASRISEDHSWDLATEPAPARSSTP